VWTTNVKRPHRHHPLCGKSIGATVTVESRRRFAPASSVRISRRTTGPGRAGRRAELRVARCRGDALAGAIRIRRHLRSKAPTHAALYAKSCASRRKSTITASTAFRISIRRTQSDACWTPSRFINDHAGKLDESAHGKNSITLAIGKRVRRRDAGRRHRRAREDPRCGRRTSSRRDLGELVKLLEKLIGLKPGHGARRRGADQGNSGG